MVTAIEAITETTIVNVFILSALINKSYIYLIIYYLMQIK